MTFQTHKASGQVKDGTLNRKADGKGKAGTGNGNSGSAVSATTSCACPDCAPQGTSDRGGWSRSSLADVVLDDFENGGYYVYDGAYDVEQRRCSNDKVAGKHWIDLTPFLFGGQTLD